MPFHTRCFPLCNHTWLKCSYDSNGIASYTADHSKAGPYKGFLMFGDVLTHDRKSSEGAYSVYDEIKFRTSIVFDRTPDNDISPLADIQLGDYLYFGTPNQWMNETNQNPDSNRKCNQGKQRVILGGISSRSHHSDGQPYRDQVTLWL